MLYDPKWEVEIKTDPQEEWRKLLLDAADLIERTGHIKKLVSDYCGTRFCIGGAIGYVRSGGQNRFICSGEDPVVARAYAALDSVTPGYPNFIDFNDHRDTTKEMVLEVMRAAARM